jgi:hypothetical protein
VRALQAEGTCYATPSYWHDKPVMRFSFCNAITTESDALRMAEALARVVGSAIEASAGGRERVDHGRELSWNMQPAEGSGPQGECTLSCSRGCERRKRRRG